MARVLHTRLVIKLYVITSLLLSSLCVVYTQEKAKDFSFHDKEGTIETLSGLNGEVVYISFWASWCRPCISNFKKYYEIREQLQDKGVVLLNVNIDREKTKWTNSIDLNPWINGRNVRAEDIEEVQEMYELYSIPSYEILNKRGVLVYLSDEPGRSIIDSFQAWLSE